MISQDRGPGYCFSTVSGNLAKPLRQYARANTMRSSGPERDIVTKPANRVSLGSLMRRLVSTVNDTFRTSSSALVAA
jgi:hypothetical protein